MAVKPVPAIVRHGVIRARLNTFLTSERDPVEFSLDMLADLYYLLSRRRKYLRTTDQRNRVRLTGVLAYTKAVHTLLVELEEDLARQGVSFKPKRRRAIN